MKSSTEDQIEGAAHEVKGGVKEKAGQILHKPDLEAEGQDEKLLGTIRKKVGQVEKVLEK
ncbi:MAG: CsbD family protein [Bryobacteraceae bacterium]